MIRCLDRLHAERIHNFQRRRHGAGGDDFGDSLGSVVHAAECSQHHTDRCGDWRELHQRLGHDAKHPLGANDSGREVQPTVPGLVGIHPDNIPRWQDHLHTENMIGRNTVLEAMRSTSVLGDIAADGTGFLAGRIWGEEEMLVLHVRGEIEVNKPRLDQGSAIALVHLQHPVHSRERDNDAAIYSNGTPAQARAGTACNDWQTMFTRNLHHSRDLLS